MYFVEEPFTKIPLSVINSKPFFLFASLKAIVTMSINLAMVSNSFYIFKMLGFGHGTRPMLTGFMHKAVRGQRNQLPGWKFQSNQFLLSSLGTREKLPKA